MKNILALVLFGASVWITTSCQKEEQEVEKKEKPVMQVEEPIIPSAKFASFVNGFEAGLPPTVYDNYWLEGFLDNNKVREISPKVCEDFIHGKVIWNHSFDQQEKKALSSDKPYYYIGQISDTGKYIMLIFSDLEEKATETYLCTYTKDGKFISGIVLQANYIDDANPKEVKEKKRVSKIPAEANPTLIVEESTEEGTKATVYSISDNGEIRPNQHSS